MKKSLLALAVMGAFATAAQAQSSVTVYGIVDLGVTSVSTGGQSAASFDPYGNLVRRSNRTTGITSGGQSSSRIGFKGKEDLGGGLAATFQLEAAIAADTGNSGNFNRVSTVGLEGGFGKVNLGRQIRPIKDAYDRIDPFGDAGAIAPISGIFYAGLLTNISDPAAAATAGGALASNNGRMSNSIKYSSNSYGGFAFGVSYEFGERAGRASADSAYSLNAGYTNGPVDVQFGYANRGITDNTDFYSITNSATKTHKLTALFLGATYNFGAAKLHVAYGDGKLKDVITPNNNDKVRNYLLGVSAKVGANGTILGSYATNSVREFAGIKPTQADSKRFGVAYAHSLSKRTNLYTGVSRTSNDNNVNIQNGELGKSGSTFAVGIRHRF